VCALPGAGRICIINAKGARARIANPDGPGPAKIGLPTRSIHNLLTGKGRAVPLPPVRR